MISSSASFGKKSFKYFVGYKDNDTIEPLCIIIPELSRYAKSFDETK